MSVHAIGFRELADVLDGLREGIQVIDREFRYRYLNVAAAAHGRKARDELLGRRMTDCYPGIEHTAMYRELERCLAGRCGASLENEFTYADGKRGVFELRIEPCELGVVVLSIDVTEQRRLREQFLHAQKMEAVGRLAGSVAHDFNNALSVILSSSTLLLNDLKPVDPLREDIELIKRAGDNAARLTRQLLAFSRQQVLRPRLLDLNLCLRDSEAMLRRLLGEDVELVLRCRPDVPPVRVDPGQVDQIVMNLAVNARDAMPEGGALTIETSLVELDSSYASEHFSVKPGRYVLLAVSDTGVGIEKELQARIFEPFFTTKEPGRGTGLGLSTVFGIVQQSGGNVWVYSEPRIGTTFKLYFPAAEGDDESVRESVPPATLEGNETVLLVEDQDEVRRVAERILRRYGYHVLEARNAGEAWLSCERYPREIHLLLTDMVMPQMSGRELAERLLRVRPQMRVVFMSGYTPQAVVQHGLLGPAVEYLQKPIVPQTLLRSVRQVLDAPADSQRRAT